MFRIKRFILFIMSMIVPLLVIALCSLATPASESIYLADYVLLFDQKSLKGSYLDLISIDQNGQEYSSRFKDSLSMKVLLLMIILRLLKAIIFILWI